jgi:hypothetical protein
MDYGGFNRGGDFLEIYAARQTPAPGEFWRISAEGFGFEMHASK